MITRTGKSTSSEREGRGSRHGEEAEDEETEGEMAGDVVTSPLTELPGKQRQTLSMISPLYPQHLKRGNPPRLQLHLDHRKTNNPLSSGLLAWSLRVRSPRWEVRAGQIRSRKRRLREVVGNVGSHIESVLALIAPAFAYMYSGGFISWFSASCIMVGLEDSFRLNDTQRAH